MKLRKKDPGKTEARPSEASPEAMELRAALAEIAAEGWRFGHAVEKAAQRMDIMDAERFTRQFSYFSTRVRQALQKAELTSLDLTGARYDVGMAVQAMNLEEFEEDEELIVTRMIEPVILWNGRVMKTGVVMLGRATE